MIKETLFSLILLSSFSLYADVDAIIGKDTRKQVTNVNADLFFQSVGYVHDDDKNSSCTGTLITQKHVLTNGHCVVLWNEFPTPLARVQAFTFIPARTDKTSAPSGFFKVVKIKTFSSWTQIGDHKSDIAVLELDRPTGIRPAKIVSFKNLNLLRNQKITVTGYSSNKPNGTMWYGEGVLKDILSDKQSLTHDADTLPGTSGALIRMKYKDEWVGVGVHRGSFDYKGERINRGVIFNSNVFEAIKRWVQ